MSLCMFSWLLVEDNDEVWRLMQKEKRTQQVGANRNSFLFYAVFLFSYSYLFQFYTFKRAKPLQNSIRTAPIRQHFCLKRTTWNEECLRKAVATIGKEWPGFGGPCRFKAWSTLKHIGEQTAKGLLKNDAASIYESWSPFQEFDFSGMTSSTSSKEAVERNLSKDNFWRIQRTK